MQVPQKFNFRPNCKSRMLVDVEVTFPKLALTNVALGEPQLGWLGRLNASKRNSSVRRSANLIALIVEKSQLITPGPIRVLRPALP